MLRYYSFYSLLLVLSLYSQSFSADPIPSNRWWREDVESALAKAESNAGELKRVLNTVSPEQRKGAEFLIANMPDQDLKSLKADFLITNIELAYRARKETPWGQSVPEEIFLNDVLPYANVDEKRDAWRKEFFELCMPLIKSCKTPTEAAIKLNADLFKKLKLGYSTQRKAPNQSPRESIDLGKASCTGLSIVLSDACRSVCIPARLVGTPLWTNKRGNHTWVEIWDKGWHFTGACEPDPNGLDRGWFVGDASLAQKNSFEHAIYAASFRKSKQHFPLVWAMENKDIPAENVTDRYAKQPPTKSLVQLQIRVLSKEMKRISTEVTIIDAEDSKITLKGTSRGESADLNDLLVFDLKPNHEYFILTKDTKKAVMTGTAGQSMLVEIVANP